MMRAATLGAALGAWLAGAASAAPLESVAALPAAEIVILGEAHDNPAHHANQAEAVARLAPAALVFEMMSPEQAATAERLGPADAAALASALDWEASGWPDFAMYHPILAAAPEAAIRGAALPRERVRRAMTDGAAAVFGADAAAYGLTPLPPELQAEREAGQQAVHCGALPEAMLPGMVAAQRLRDAHFARVALDAFRQTGGPIAVITGNGHARTDRGIPAALAVAAPDLTVVALGQLESPPDTSPPYDAWLLTEGVERADPCAALTE